jgi:tetratricopeptide (TPR) repeat protein
LASAELQAVLKVAPKHVPAKFAQARVLAKSGKIDAAQKQLAELASAYPAAPSIPEVQGDLALAQNHSNEATAYYRTALGKGETNFLVSKLAASQLRSGDRMGGLTTLRSWLTRYPNDDYVRGSLADALLGMGQSAEAGEHYAKLLQRQPKNVSAANNLAWISLETGALQKAVAYAQQAYKLAPKRPEVLDTYGMVLLKQGLARDAVERLREAQSLARGNTAISLHYAEALIADKKRPEARKLLREVLDDMKTPPLNRQKAQALLNSL